MIKRFNFGKKRFIEHCAAQYSRIVWLPKFSDFVMAEDLIFNPLLEIFDNAFHSFQSKRFRFFVECGGKSHL
jgi:hypothetical protein